MAIAVEDKPAQRFETKAIASPPARGTGIGMKKLLMVPVAFVAVFVLIDGPNHDGLAKGGIYGAMLGGSGLALAIVCSKSWQDISSILWGEIVGITLVASSMIDTVPQGDVEPEFGPHYWIMFGTFMGWLVMQPFRLIRRKSVPNLETTLAEPHDSGA